MDIFYWNMNWLNSQQMALTFTEAGYQENISCELHEFHDNIISGAETHTG
jgi:hypothetical protein